MSRKKMETLRLFAQDVIDAASERRKLLIRESPNVISIEALGRLDQFFRDFAAAERARINAVFLSYENFFRRADK